MSLPERLSPIAATLPPANAMSVTLSIACDGSTMRPPFNTRSFIRSLYHPLQPQPVGHQAQLLAQRTSDLSRIDTVLEMHGVGEKPAAGAIGLEIDPADQPVAEQEGQYVIDVIALMQRRVDLGGRRDIEKKKGAVVVPD